MGRCLAITPKRVPFAGAGDEPALAELLADPILHLLMRRDRLSDGDVLQAIARGRAALGERHPYGPFTLSRLEP